MTLRIEVSKKGERTTCGIRCEKCFFWKNLAETPYNNLHKNFKKCGIGAIINAQSNTCDYFTVIKPKGSCNKTRTRRSFNL
jgi:hypothetical protein